MEISKPTEKQINALRKAAEASRAAFDARVKHSPEFGKLFKAWKKADAAYRKAYSK